MFTIQTFTAKRMDRGLLSRDMQPGHVAIVKFDNGDWIGLSRYHDENVWLADCAFRGNGYPVFSHGEGSRDCAKRVMSDPDILAELTRLLNLHNR